MGFLDLFRARPKHAAEAAARRYVPMVVRWRRKNPSKPLRELLSGKTLALLRHLVPPGSAQSEALERLMVPGEITEDVQALCERLVSFETGITEGDREGWIRVTQAVSAELNRMGVAAFPRVPDGPHGGA